MPAQPALETRIRPAGAGDAPVIAGLSRTLIETGLGWSWTRERVLRAMADAEVNVIVAQRPGGTLAGFGLMKYGDAQAHLLLLAVRPEHARRGVGSALVGWLEQSARVAGIGRVVLEVRSANAGAIAFYRQLGYTAMEALNGYYQGREAALRMQHLLDAGEEA